MATKKQSIYYNDYEGAIDSMSYVILSDTFTGTDGTHLHDHTPDINLTGDTWHDPLPAWQLNSNALKKITGDNFLSYIKLGVLEYEATITVKDMPVSADFDIGLTLRHNGATTWANTRYLYLRLHSNNNGQVDLLDGYGGAHGYLVNNTAWTRSAGDHTLKVKVTQTKIQAWVDDIQYIDYSTSLYNQNTGFGFSMWTGCGCYFDTLSVKVSNLGFVKTHCSTGEELITVVDDAIRVTNSSASKNVAETIGISTSEDVHFNAKLKFDANVNTLSQLLRCGTDRKSYLIRHKKADSLLEICKGKFKGNSYLFNGNYVDFTNDSHFDIASNSVTFAFWIKNNDVTALKVPLSRGWYGASGFYLQSYNSNWEILHNTSTVLRTNGGLSGTSGVWTHWTFKKVGGDKWQCYKNGVELTYLIQAISDPGSLSVSLILGDNHGYSLAGSYTDFRWWNRALSDSEIVSVAKGGDVSSGLILKCDMAEGGGSACLDSSGSAHNGTINGVTTSLHTTEFPTEALEVLASTSKVYATDTWFDSEVDITDGIITASVNGVRVTYTDASPIVSGWFGIQIINNAGGNTYLDDNYIYTETDVTYTIAEYLKRGLLTPETEITFQLNLGDELQTEQDITKYAVEIGEIAENLSLSDVNAGGSILPNLDITLDNSKGIFEKAGEKFKDGFVNNSLVKVETKYKSPDDEEITPAYCFKGLIKNTACQWDRINHQFKTTLIPSSNLFNVEKIQGGTVTSGSFEDVLYQMLHRQPFIKYLTIDKANWEFGWDIANVVDTVSEVVDQNIKDIMDAFMLLSGSVYYINSDQELIIEPILNDTPSILWTLRGSDIFTIEGEEFDWNGQNTGLVWDDGTLAIKRAEFSYTNREKYQYDYKELAVDYKFVANLTNRQTLLNNMLELMKWLRRKVTITCKWNPEINVNSYVSLDVPEESILGSDFMTFNKTDDNWNAGLYWGIPQPGITFNSTDIWRVVEVGRSSLGEQMKLTLVQLYSDDNK